MERKEIKRWKRRKEVFRAWQLKCFSQSTIDLQVLKLFHCPQSKGYRLRKEIKVWEGEKKKDRLHRDNKKFELYVYVLFPVLV